MFAVLLLRVQTNKNRNLAGIWQSFPLIFDIQDSLSPVFMVQMGCALDMIQLRVSSIITLSLITISLS